MKCSNCWSRRIDSADTSLLHKMLATVLMLKPVKCRHCFHTFHIPLWQRRPVENEVSNAAASVEEQQDAVIFPFSEIKKQVESKSESIGFREAA